MQVALQAMTAPMREAAIPIPTDDLERLFQAHNGLVFRTAYRITGNASDAEDALQTVFLRLAGQDSSTLVVEKSASYLRRAAINAALDVIRARHAGDREPLDDAYPDPVRGDRHELEDCLRRSLACLTPAAAEMFALRFLEGHSYNEIAKMLGTSRVRVGVTLHRARRRLQIEIRRYLEGKS